MPPTGTETVVAGSGRPANTHTQALAVSVTKTRSVTGFTATAKGAAARAPGRATGVAGSPGFAPSSVITVPLVQVK